jgi:hypothetical protein
MAVEATQKRKAFGIQQDASEVLLNVLDLLRPALGRGSRSLSASGTALVCGRTGLAIAVNPEQFEVGSGAFSIRRSAAPPLPRLRRRPERTALAGSTPPTPHPCSSAWLE